MKTKNLIYLVFILILIITPILVSAQENEENEKQVFGIGIDELIVFGSAILAIFLFILTFIAYKRDGRTRLLYVAIAFLLFAIKGVLISVDVFFPQKGSWADPLANFLDFAILLSFFFGVVRKGG